jgi:hypothetical protein
MADIIESEQDYIKFAEIHDDLGWDNFVEGRTGKSLFTFKRSIYPPIHTYFKFSWSSGLQLLILTHQQLL